MCVDLHTHSVHSDGTSSVEELVTQAARLHLAGYALTDHDTIEGQEEAIDLGKQHDVPLVTGLEVSAVHKEHSLHILAYGFDHRSNTFQTWLERLQQGRNKRNRTIIEKLRKLGLDVSHDELDSISDQGQTGRPHIARLLLKKKIVSNLDQAFRRYLGRDKPAWAPRFTYTAQETIAAIHMAGGLAVLAHPGLLDSGMKLQTTLITELAAYGLDGIETYYPSHSSKMQSFLMRLAGKNNLVMTGGSDYHGDNKPGTGLAGSGRFCPPDTIMGEIAQRLRKNNLTLTPTKTVEAKACIPS